MEKIVNCKVKEAGGAIMNTSIVIHKTYLKNILKMIMFLGLEYTMQKYPYGNIKINIVNMGSWQSARFKEYIERAWFNVFLLINN